MTPICSLLPGGGSQPVQWVIASAMLCLLPQEGMEARQCMQMTTTWEAAAQPVPQLEYLVANSWCPVSSEEAVTLTVSPLEMDFPMSQICSAGHIAKHNADKHGFAALRNMALVIIGWHATLQLFFKLCYCWQCLFDMNSLWHISSPIKIHLPLSDAK